MEILFYLSSVVAVIATLRTITHTRPLYALLYLVVSLLFISCSFFSLGAYFAGALEVIIYAGAIMVLFVFVIMLLNADTLKIKFTFNFLDFVIYLSAFLFFISLLTILSVNFSCVKDCSIVTAYLVDAKKVGLLLFGPYLLVVEVVSMLLLGGLLIVLHFGHDRK
ncbi:NADH-quinone oxidoreductase subunit J [Blochmannia endosymbiont of Colobopsis nipponica]|uniref:NADH-quinone oxidoreductase subunit J n=1 Tax=Blochmannia endosymbiont of Colobopsis nipponica TaxID=2681987 RepID=UPI00177E9933|nr:NADH-quinone oxidoreductase subunit J [Blochmannia endosymbiont of Colobopsis nipponica]QOI10980.1 NADH-quinone oxidoreductase subunit J [Blochmannia endosymbiont of Colobopsis nipponica]